MLETVDCAKNAMDKRTSGTVKGDIMSQGTQIGLKGDDRKHLGFHNQDGSVRMWLYKDKRGDGVHLNNGNDGGGDWVFNKNGHFYSPQALHAAGATYQEDGNIHGSLWGGHLSGWLNNTFVRDIRLGHMQEVQIWRGPGYRDEPSHVITGVYNGNGDDYVDFVQRRVLQKNINGNWINVWFM
uniref:Tail fibre protein gp37 trimerization region domain-containing protein n=1 Tax=Arsenophonus endosymbiont of Trialeurodes vaporariorum TaxID=235567 RepID=A0A3B0MG27_9GAMM